MKKVIALLFLFVILFSVSVSAVNVCSDPSQVIFKVNQTNGGYVTAGNLNYPSFGVFGDVNLDGFVDANDLTVLNEFLLGVRTLDYWGEKMADVNLDGGVDVADLILLADYLDKSLDEEIPKLPYYFETESYIVDVLWGDANQDGVVNLSDVSFLSDYFDGEVELSRKGMKFADVNLDGFVTSADSSLIAINVSGLSQQKLPQYQGVYVDPVFGDINFDGDIYADDLVKISTFIYRNNIGQSFDFEDYGFILADVNLDRVVDNFDLVILYDFLNLGDIDRIVDSLPFYSESVGTEIIPLFGDADLDGSVTLNDAREINFRPEQLPKYGKILADVNLDGVVNSDDAALITLNVSNSGDNKIPQFNGKYVGEYALEEVCYDDLFGEVYDGEKPRENCNEANTIFSLDKRMDSRVSINPVYGDITGDRVVNSDDVQQIIQYRLNTRDFNDWEKLMADVDLDGNIDETDLNLILNASLGIASLPYKIGTDINKVSTTTYGDLNSDNSVNVADLILMPGYIIGGAELSPIAKKMADVQVDGEINVADLIRLSSFILGQITSLPYEGETAINSPLVFGDLTGDGFVDLAADHVLLHQYLLGEKSLTNYQKAMADVNLDGFVDGGDLLLIHFSQIDPSIVSGLPVSYEYINSPISIPNFNNNICYGNLYCEVEKSSGNSCENGGEIVARLENLYDSRVSIGVGSTNPYKICCIQRDIYWAKMDGTLITEAHVGQSVQMIVTGRGSEVDSNTKFKVIEDDSGLGDADSHWGNEFVGNYSVENVNGDAVGVFQADRGVIEASQTGDYEEFVFIGESLGIKSGNLKINMSAKNDPLVLELISPECGADFEFKSPVNISFRVSDPDDLVNVTVKIVDSLTKIQSDQFNYTHVNGIVSFSYNNFLFPGSYSIIVEAYNGRAEIRKAVSNIMVTSLLFPNYVAACIDNPLDSYRVNPNEEINFDGSSSRAITLNSTGTFEHPHSNIYFNWTLSDEYGIEGLNVVNFTHTLVNESGFGWVNLEVSLQE